MKFASGQKKDSRLGLVVSKKSSKKAVVRNLVKRQIKAAVKPLLPEIKKPADIILIALPGLETKKFAEINGAIEKLFKKAKLIR